MRHIVPSLFLITLLVGCAPKEEPKAVEETKAPAPAAEPAKVPFVSVPELKELMAEKVEVDAEALWNAPLADPPVKTAADWKKLEDAAGRIAETGKSLLNPPLSKDDGKWKEESQKMIDMAEATRQAAQKKDIKALEETGSKMLEQSCTTCHMIYFNP